MTAVAAHHAEERTFCILETHANTPRVLEVHGWSIHCQYVVQLSTEEHVGANGRAPSPDQNDEVAGVQTMAN